ncbi:Protein that interacts physically and genetically with Tap42p which regulates protein phosphatase 2 [Fasciolopsis buskii]|uniref:TIP41-like protein n=1 Tax=Fasciolopsis buskii TaxID=27845 RepID=A0A8E0RZ05_9TREM|nr:Protein that interacts physically and genetically with Tap42p which regulates protein phosphatase 2 [Fasciolopsis buski]
MNDVMTTASPGPKVSTFETSAWSITLTEHHILKSLGEERKKFESQLSLPNLPEMIFDKNSLRITCKNPNGPAISFNTPDALAGVNSKEIPLELPVAKDWREARINQEESWDQPKPYDWTFTTPYNGTLSGPWNIVPDENGLDMALLQRREPILFYADTTLYEDELGDNGVSMLNVKFRAMNSGFFLLQRFFLRVDSGLVRCFDTRLQWRAHDNYLIRAVRQAESSSWTPEMMGIKLPEADRVCDKVIKNYSEKLFPLAA